MDTSLLIWAKGTGLQLATLIMLGGLIMRVSHMLILGRSKDLSEARDVNLLVAGMKTIIRRFKPPAGMFKKSPFVYINGYVFHLGLFVIIVFSMPHIEVFEGAFGISWPGLSRFFIDAVTVITILSLLLGLAYRLWQPVHRLLSGWDDYLVWTLTFLPLLTGYMAYHHLMSDYITILTLHILSVELLMICVPFTSLSHMLTLFVARAYNGMISGRKGVQS